MRSRLGGFREISMKKQVKRFETINRASAPTSPNIDTISMTFREFMDGNFEGTHNLYIIWYGDRVLYVGISEGNVWNRWFSGDRSHMYQHALTQNWKGETTIGRVVAHNLPESLSWRVDLRYYGIWNNKDLRIEEMNLIRQLRGLFNSMHGVELTKEDNDLIRKLLL
jgi:hypothetical protein